MILSFHKGNIQLNILEEAGKPIGTIVPMDSNVKFIPGGETLKVWGPYRRLVGKLKYLTIAHLDIPFVVIVVSQFHQVTWESYWNAIFRILGILKELQANVCCMKTGYIQRSLGIQMQIGHDSLHRKGQLRSIAFQPEVIWYLKRSKKRDVVAKSSAKKERVWALALITGELIWLKQLLQELKYGRDKKMKLICDN